MPKTHDLSRRSLLRSLVATSALPSLLDVAMTREARAQGARKILMIYLPDGYGDYTDWHPDVARTAPGSLKADDLKPASSNFAPVVGSLTLIDGLRCWAGGSQHPGGCRKVLNGQEGSKFSIDVDIGRRLGTPFPYLALGVASKWSGANEGLTVENGSTVDAIDNPGQLLSKLGVRSPGAAADPTARDFRDLRMTAALELALTHGERLRSTLGGVYKTNLETTLASLEAERSRVQNRIDAPSTATTGSAGASCEPATRGIMGYGETGYPKPYFASAVRMEVAEQQFKLAKFAFQCGITRVVNIHWGHKVSDFQGWHDKSHGKWSLYRAVRAPVYQQIVRWVQELERDKMLSDTLVFGYSELGHSGTHDHDRVPFFLIGGGLGNGRALDYRGTNTLKRKSGESECHTKLLVSLARWMGDTTKTEQGYTGHGTGPLPEFPLG